MIKVKSDSKLLIEFRNQIAFRLVERKANLQYWKAVVRQSKSGSSAMLEAVKNKEVNERDIKKDTLFVKCIDEMIKKGKI